MKPAKGFTRRTARTQATGACIIARMGPYEVNPYPPPEFIEYLRQQLAEWRRVVRVDRITSSEYKHFASVLALLRSRLDPLELYTDIEFEKLVNCLRSQDRELFVFAALLQSRFLRANTSVLGCLWAVFSPRLRLALLSYLAVPKLEPRYKRSEDPSSDLPPKALELSSKGLIYHCGRELTNAGCEGVVMEIDSPRDLRFETSFQLMDEAKREEEFRRRISRLRLFSGLATANGLPFYVLPVRYQHPPVAGGSVRSNPYVMLVYAPLKGRLGREVKREWAERVLNFVEEVYRRAAGVTGTESEAGQSVTASMEGAAHDLSGTVRIQPAVEFLEEVEAQKDIYTRPLIIQTARE